MAERSLGERVRVLEESVEELGGVPSTVARIESQIVQLGDEMRDEFSAVRRERGSQGEQLRNEMAGMRAELSAEMAAMRDDLRAELRSGDEETRRYMRVLHEDLVSRIALLTESFRRRRKRPPP